MMDSRFHITLSFLCLITPPAVVAPHGFLLAVVALGAARSPALLTSSLASPLFFAASPRTSPQSLEAVSLAPTYRNVAIESTRCLFELLSSGADHLLPLANLLPVRLTTCFVSLSCSAIQAPRSPSSTPERIIRQLKLLGSLSNTLYQSAYY